eukprot:824628-Rhodomonas_salina.1
MAHLASTELWPVDLRVHAPSRTVLNAAKSNKGCRYPGTVRTRNAVDFAVYPPTECPVLTQQMGLSG